MPSNEKLTTGQIKKLVGSPSLPGAGPGETRSFRSFYRRPLSNHCDRKAEHSSAGRRSSCNACGRFPTVQSVTERTSYAW
jgi:hypothetical protein